MPPKKDLAKIVKTENETEQNNLNILTTDTAKKHKKVIVYETSDTDESEDDVAIQAPKIEVIKPKKKFTMTPEDRERRIKQLEKANAIRREKLLIRNQEKQLIEEQERKAREEKIVKKAISIKKKQIKRDLVLDEISDDDEDIEIIKKIVAKKKPQPVKPQEIKKPPQNTTKFIFV
jgi:hypothetical protein